MDGFPHSEIPGSKPAHGSPGLIAACHVLHRLHAPRHPPNALQTLERYPFNSPPMLRERRSRRTVPPVATGDHGISHFSLHLERGAIAARRPWDAFPPGSGTEAPSPCRNASRVRTLFTMSISGSAAGRTRRSFRSAERRTPLGATPFGPSEGGPSTDRRSMSFLPDLLKPGSMPPFQALGSGPRVQARPAAGFAGRGLAGMVEPTGFEPVTPCLQSRRSPS